jgi:hypothetical protein
MSDLSSSRLLRITSGLPVRIKPASRYRTGRCPSGAVLQIFALRFSRNSDLAAHRPCHRHPCKSFVKLSHGCPGHARGSVQVNSPRMLHTQKYASRHRFLRSAEPDIHLLSQTPKSRHRRLSVCSLPVPKQFVESLGSLISFAQSAKCRTWQSAHGSSCLFSGSLQAAAVLRSSAGIKSLCFRSTASR